MDTAINTLRQQIMSNPTLLDDKNCMAGLLSDVFQKEDKIGMILKEMSTQGLLKSIYDIRCKCSFSEQVYKMMKSYSSIYREDYVTNAFNCWAKVVCSTYEPYCENNANAPKKVRSSSLESQNNRLTILPNPSRKSTNEAVSHRQIQVTHVKKPKTPQQLFEKSDELHTIHVILFIVFALISVLLLCIMHFTHFFLTLLLCVVAGFIFAVLIQDT